MADLQISALPALAEAGIQATDNLALADLSATETKKVTVKDLIAAGVALIDTGDIPASKVGTLGTNQVSTGALGAGVVTNAKIETSTSSTTGIDGGQKLIDGSVTVDKLDSTKFDRGLSVASSKLGITNSITAGTKSGITYTAQGLISGVADLTATDLPEATSSAIGAVKVESSSLLEVSNTGAIDVKDVSGLSAGTYASVTVNAKGQVTAGSTQSSATNIPTATTSAKGGVIVPTSGGMSVDGNGNLSIATQGSVSAGDYAKVTVNTKGIVTGTGTLADTDIPDHSAAKLTSGTIPAARIGSSAINASRLDSGAVTNDKVETSTSNSTGLDGASKLRDGTITAAKLNTSNIDRSLNVASGNLGINNTVTAATRSGITYNAQGLITATAALGASDLPVATTSAVGGVSVGTGLSVSGAGALSITNSVTGATVSGITFNAQGMITAATALVAGDLPTATTSAKGAVQITSGGGLTVDGSGNLTTSTSGISAGTYQSITVNNKGVATAGAALTAALIPDLAASKITSGSLDAARIANDSIDGTKLSNASTAVFQSIAQSGYPTAQFSGQILFDTVSEDAFIWDGNAWQAITTLTKGSLVFGGTYNANTSQMVATTSAGIAAGLSVGSNLPTASSTTDGVYVVVATGGTPSSPAPAIAFAPPDYILGVTNSAGSSWNEVDLSQTVAGQVASNITFSPYGQLSSTNVQDALQELETEKLAKSGGTVTGELLIGNAGSFVFEGSTVDAFETRLTVADPTTSDKTITLPNVTGTVITSGDTNTVTSTMVDGSLVNANLSATAAISFSKLAALTSAQILVGNGSNVATAVAVTGDIGINNAGLTSITAGAIVNADVSSTAAITGSKITTGTTSAVGVLQLTDSATSTSATTAATPAAVKIAKDAADAAATTANAALPATGGTLTGNVIIDNAKELRLSEADGDGAHFTGFKAQAQSADITYTLPATAPTTGQVLKSGSTATTLEWATDSATDSTKMPLAGGTFTGDVTFTGDSSNGLWDKSASAFVANLSGTATLATEFTVTANNSTDETVYPLFADGATGSQGAETDTGLTYNPSTGLLTSTGFSGAGTSLTALNASNLSSGTVNVARLGSGSSVSTKFLRGDNTWQTISSTPEGTAILSTGESGGTKFLREDGDGTCSWQTVTGTTINNNANNRLITGSGTANTLEAESGLTWDGTNLDMGDDKKIRFGDGQDFEIYHDGPSPNNYNVITNISGRQLRVLAPSGFAIDTSSIGGNPVFFASADGVYLKDSNMTTRLQSTTSGVTITGTATATTFSGSGASLTNLPAANITGTLPAISGANLTNVNATTLDSIDSGSFLRSDASDQITSGVLTMSSSEAYPLQITGSNDSKIILKGTSNPLIRFQEASTDKALVGWNSSGFLRLTNNEDGSELRIRDDLSFALDGSTFNSVIHAGNVGSGGALSSTNVYVNQIHGDGSNLTNLPASGGTITATASGAIAANKPVIINSSGQAEEVSTPADSAGSGAEATTASIGGVRVFGNGAGQYILAWISGSTIKAYVATISGTTVSYGTAVDLETSAAGGYRDFDICYIPGKDCYGLGFDHSGGVSARTFKVSGTSITVSSRNHINSNNENSISVAAVTKSGDPGYSDGVFTLFHYDQTYGRTFLRGLKVNGDGSSGSPQGTATSYWSYSSVNRARCAYHEGETRFYAIFRRSNDLEAVTWNVGSDGTSMSRDNNGVTLVASVGDSGSDDGLDNSVVYEPNSNKLILSYTADSNKEAFMRTITYASSSSYTLGSALSLGNNRQFVYLAEYNDKIYATYTDSSADNGTGDLQIRDISISGTTLTAGTETEISSDDHRKGSCVGGSAGIFIGYRNQDSSSRPTGYFFKVGTTNLTTGNFVGFADAAISNGASGTINVISNTTTQSSLTAGQKYYVQGNGTLSTTADSPSVEAGTALSSTELLIKG